MSGGLHNPVNILANKIFDLVTEQTGLKRDHPMFYKICDAIEEKMIKFSYHHAIDGRTLRGADSSQKAFLEERARNIACHSLADSINEQNLVLHTHKNAKDEDDYGPGTVIHDFELMVLKC